MNGYISVNAQTNGESGLYLNENGSVRWYFINDNSPDNNFSIIDGSNNIRFAIAQSTGNVGIGTTTPGQLLSVNGNGFFAGNLTVATTTYTLNASSTNLTATNFWSTNGTITNASTTYLTVSGSAFLASSTMNGFNICTSANGVCAGSLDGTTGQIAYFSGTDTAVGTSTIFIDTNGNVGIASTSPSAVLSVNVSNATGITPALNINSATSSLLYVRSDGFIGIGTTTASIFTTPYATTTPKLSISGDVLISNGGLNLPTITSTTTIAGGFDVGNRAFTVEPSSGLTSIINAEMGPTRFETDAGVVSWIDMPVASSSNNTVLSYSAMMNGTSTITVYGLANGSGGVTNIGVGIGTTTPTQMLTISTANATSSVAITNGWLCIDNDGGCAGSAAGTMYSRYADITGGSDIAERYGSNETLEAGDIVQIKKFPNIERATASSTTIIGIISSAPAMTVGSVENATSTYPVALAGRVPVKVSLENGPIAIGDRITISSVLAGVGMKANATTTTATVGIALEAFDGTTPSSVSDTGGTLVSDTIPGAATTIPTLAIGEVGTPTSTPSSVGASTSTEPTATSTPTAPVIIPETSTTTP